MQPTPATRTDPSRPASRTAPCKRASTPSEPDETHPAATQQRTWAGGRAFSSPAAISSRSDSSIRQPSFQLAEQACGVEAALDLAVEHHRGRDPAGAQAAGGHEGQPAVRGGFAGPDLGLLADG